MEDTIKEKLQANLNILEIYLKDQSGGCGKMYFLIVIAEEFTDMKLLDR
jgi:stress-induced morphogen